MRKCPNCGKTVERIDSPWRPFCSERCQLIDFDKWASEEYRVPGQQISPAQMPHPEKSDEADEQWNEN